ncbi:MAG: hypothetical protein LKE40_15135 [Spirochaetia bacterium]|nr:hypothetical protein [Spirochaetia bacterium]
MLFIPAIHLVIPYYLDSAYSGIMPLITVCTVAFLFDCFSTILEGVFGNSINSMPILISTVVGTVTVLCIIVPLVTRFGTVGAAVTTAIGFFPCCLNQADLAFHRKSLQDERKKDLILFAIGRYSFLLCNHWFCIS